MQDIKLNKDIPVPLYYQLKQIILSKINSGELKVEDSLLTEMDFVNTLGISRSTIRQAVIELVREGYLYRLKGKGTFVSKPKIEESFFNKLESFNNEMLQKGLKPSTRVLEFKKIPSDDNINRILSIGENDELIYLCRLRYANNEPVVFLETYISYGKHEELLMEDFSVKSLYAVLKEKYGETVHKAVRKIEAVNVEDYIAKLLNIKKNAAACLVKTIAYTSENTPLEYSVARYRGDRNQFTVELTRK